MITLNSQLMQRLLDFFFSHEDERFYVNEIARRLGVDKRNLVRKLKELEKKGLFVTESIGNMRFYSINKGFPLFEEYKKIVLRTVGFEKRLRSALQEVQGIDKAYIYGSYAKDRTDALSDIDVLVIGSHGSVALQERIARLQRDYDREINVISLSQEEFRRRRDDPFIRDVMRGDKVELKQPGSATGVR